MYTIAVYPVGAWWKYLPAQDRWRNSVRFSLLVSIDSPEESVDIYSVVELVEWAETLVFMLSGPAPFWLFEQIAAF